VSFGKFGYQRLFTTETQRAQRVLCVLCVSVVKSLS